MYVYIYKTVHDYSFNSFRKPMEAAKWPKMAQKPHVTPAA